MLLLCSKPVTSHHTKNNFQLIAYKVYFTWSQISLCHKFYCFSHFHCTSDAISPLFYNRANSNIWNIFHLKVYTFAASCVYNALTMLKLAWLMCISRSRSLYSAQCQPIRGLPWQTAPSLSVYSLCFFFLAVIIHYLTNSHVIFFFYSLHKDKDCICVIFCWIPSAKNSAVTYEVHNHFCPMSEWKYNKLLSRPLFKIGLW